MKKIIILQLVILLSLQSFAQDSKDRENVITSCTTRMSSVNGPKFEIVNLNDDTQSYRINKETGEVWVLSYENAYVVSIEFSANNVTYYDKINYQLVVSKSAVYLLNLNTGEVWIMKGAPFSFKNSRFELVKKK